MMSVHRFTRCSMTAFLPAVLLLAWMSVTALAEPIVPGTGAKMAEVGDDFEAERWEYRFNSPKSSRDIDSQDRLPTGESANGRWYESVKRGHPDIVRRVETPAGGLLGSRGSLLLQSLQTGIPGRPSHQLAQDDLIADVHYRLGGAIPASRGPNVVVRVFLPPVSQWEQRTGPHFGFRVALETHVFQSTRGVVSSSGRPALETYWPGMFIEFASKAAGGEHDYARFRLRADRNGRDFQSAQITTTGWWTLGLSVTPDGMVHYFAKPGVEDLTASDRLASEFPYGQRAVTFKTFFFNVCNGDDGRNWSTPWVIDDPVVYLVR